MIKAKIAWLCLASAGVLIGSQSASAVIISGVDGSGNTTSTGAGTGWDYSGIVNSWASGVYLGNGWVLTAKHITDPSFATTIQLGGTTYSWDGITPRVQLHDPANPSTPADLQMFRVSNGPSLAWLVIPASTPGAGTAITMIGNGKDRATTPTYYDSNWNVVAQSQAVHTGFTELATQHERWGTNSTVKLTPSGAHALTQTVSNGAMSTSCFYAQFDIGAGANEAAVAYGDSGGAVFDSTGRLLGTMLYYWGPLGQPDSTAVYGDMIGYADLSQYRSQIVALVPEPSSLAVLGGVVCAGLAARRRKRA